MSKAKDFALAYYQKDKATKNEKALRQAIDEGKITPDMSLREIGAVVGINNPQLVRHYLIRFLEEPASQDKEKDGEAG